MWSVRIRNQMVTTTFSKAVKQDDRSLDKKLDPYWSIEDMMKTNKRIFSHTRRCKLFKYRILCRLKQEMQTK